MNPGGFIFKYSQPIVIGSLFCGCSAWTLGHQFFIDLKRWSSTIYVNGQEQMLSDRNRKMFEEVRNELNYSGKYETYICDENIPTYQASMLPYQTGIIGLPFNMNFETTEDIPKETVEFKRQKLNISWDHPKGEQLAESLIFSDDEKRFIFARQIRYLESYRKWVGAAVTTVTVYVSYFASFAANRLFLKPNGISISTRCFAYFTIWFAGLCIRTSMLSFYESNLDTRVDKKVASLGPLYMKGGLAYYQQIVNRNLLYRELYASPSAADKEFTRLGNERVGFFSVYGMLSRNRLFVMENVSKKLETLK